MMQILIVLLEKNDDYVTYKFGTDKIDGIMKINLVDIEKSELHMPSDDTSKSLAVRAIAKMMNLAKHGEFPKERAYACGW